MANTSSPEEVAPEILRERHEKMLIREYFDSKKSGYYVEVGANEPKTDFSQTWHLESQLDWRGILVEPNPELAQKARIERPNSMVFEAACVADEKLESIKLFIPLQGSGEITGHASIRKNIDDFAYTSHRELNVTGRTLNSILR